MDKLVCPSRASTVTAACHFRSAVQNELNSQVDINALAASCDLDTIAERGDGSVGPG